MPLLSVDCGGLSLSIADAYFGKKQVDMMEYMRTVTSFPTSEE
jgi:hypothetical protein